jgi:diacylglycerol O-acyltransferase / wax synthase
LGTLRRFGYTSLPLEDIKRIKNVHGVKVNDVILAVTSGAVRRWLVARDLLPEKSLVASVPMSLRAEGDMQGGSKLTALFCDLETQIEDPVARLHGIAVRMGSAKQVGNTLKAKEIRHLTDAVPPALVNLASHAYRGAHLETMSFVPANLAVSNIAGSPRSLYMAGARIVAMHPVAPNIVGCGLNFTVMSYLDSVDFGVITDREMIEDPWEFVDGLRAAFDELMATITDDASVAPPAIAATQHATTVG